MIFYPLPSYNYMYNVSGVFCVSSERGLTVQGKAPDYICVLWSTLEEAWSGDSLAKRVGMREDDFHLPYKSRPRPNFYPLCFPSSCLAYGLQEQITSNRQQRMVGPIESSYCESLAAFTVVLSDVLSPVLSGVLGKRTSKRTVNFECDK